MHFNNQPAWHEVLAFLEQYRQQTIFVGCSGGVDSMVLVHFLLHNDFQMHVVHVNYHKRGEESNKDMALVQQFCSNNNIPHTLADYQTTKKGNFQELARQFRYDLLQQLAQENGMIALAHHFDDQVETFFMNLMRQSGIVGLAAMPRVRHQFIRPFLQLNKQDVLDYAHQNKVEWREDASNQSTNYLRNKWRLEFLPLIEKTQPDINQAVKIIVGAFQQTQQELQQKMEPIAQQIQQTQQLSKAQVEHFSTEELFELWRQLQQPAQLFPRFSEIQSLQKGKHIELHTPYIKLVNEGTYFSFISNKRVALPSLDIQIVNVLPQHFSKTTIYLEATKIVGQLQLRKWKQGDKISPVGMKGEQLVSKIMKDAKISHAQRENTWVVCDEQHIHWVVGLKVGKFALAQPNCTEILVVKLADK
jgi:tRNA(Ile)-lysidine synthase